jgi:hypothetical protein
VLAESLEDWTAAHNLEEFLGIGLSAEPTIVADLLSEGSNRALKQCPMCAETVLSEAEVCRFCRHDFFGGSLPKYSSKLVTRMPPQWSLSPSLMIFACMCSVALIFFLAKGTISNSDYSPEDLVTQNSSSRKSSTVNVHNTSVTSEEFRTEIFTECHRKAVLLDLNPSGSFAELTAELTLLEAAVKSDRERNVLKIFQVFHTLALDFALQEMMAQEAQKMYEDYRENGQSFESNLQSMSDAQKQQVSKIREVASFYERGFVVVLPHEPKSQEYARRFTQSYDMDQKDGQHFTYFRSGMKIVSGLMSESLRQAGVALKE